MVGLPDAMIRRRQVYNKFCKFQVLIALNLSNLTHISLMQGNRHIKRVNGVYFDSKSNSRRHPTAAIVPGSPGAIWLQGFFSTRALLGRQYSV